MAQGGRGNITTRIDLDGADQVKAQLREMGAEGEKAARQIDRAIDQANSPVAKFERFVASARDRLTNFHDRAKDTTDRLRGLETSVAGVTAKITALAGGLGIAVGALGAWNTIRKAAFDTNQLEDTANNLGTTTERVQALRLEAESSGSEVGQFEQALHKFNLATAESARSEKDFVASTQGLPDVLRGGASAAGSAAAGVELLRGNLKGASDEMQQGINVLRGGTAVVTDTKDAFKLLGFSVADVRRLLRLDPFDRLKEVAPRINRLRDATVQDAVANQLFGKAWREMLPVLRDGSEGIAKAEQRVKELGIAVSDTEKGFAAGFIRSFAEARAQWSSVTTFIGNTFGQVIVPVFNYFTDLIIKNRDAIKIWATDVGTRALPVVQDLIALLKGASVGELKTDTIKSLVTTFETLKQAAQVAFVVIQQGFLLISDILAPLAALINSIFGTELTGKTLAMAAAMLYFSGVLGLIAPIIGAIIAAFTSLPIAVGIAIALIAAYLYKNRDQIIATFDAAGRAIAAVWGYVANWAGEQLDYIAWRASVAWTNITQWMWDMFVNPVIEGFKWVGGWADWLWGKIKAAWDLAKALVGLTGSAGVTPTPGFAAGGMVRGPGTSTSDSIPILASAGEYILSARAVGHWGANMIRRLNNLQNPFEGMALGGLVGAAPAQGLASAAGALGGGASTPVHLHLDGNEFGMMAEDRVARALIRTSVKSQRRSTGRAPSWRH